MAARAATLVSASASGRGSRAAESDLDALLAALSRLLTALGVPNTLRTVRGALGVGTPGGPRGPGDLAARLVDSVLPDGTGLRLPCPSCELPCRAAPRAINAARAGEAARALVRLTDACMRTYRGVTLASHVRHRLVTSADARRAGLRALGGTGRLLALAGRLAEHDVTRGARVRVLRRLCSSYLDWALDALPPGALARGATDPAALNAILFGAFKPHMVAFLRGQDADLAPLVGALIEHVARHVGPGTDRPDRTPACTLCRRARTVCSRGNAANATN